MLTPGLVTMKCLFSLVSRLVHHFLLLPLLRKHWKIYILCEYCLKEAYIPTYKNIIMVLTFNMYLVSLNCVKCVKKLNYSVSYINRFLRGMVDSHSPNPLSPCTGWWICSFFECVSVLQKWTTHYRRPIVCVIHQ
jgi:hypothetical protein